MTFEKQKGRTNPVPQSSWQWETISDGKILITYLKTEWNNQPDFLYNKSCWRILLKTICNVEVYWLINFNVTLMNKILIQFKATLSEIFEEQQDYVNNSSNGAK